MEITKTYAAINEFLGEINKWIAHPDHQTFTKFRYAALQVQKRADKIIQELNRQLTNISVKHAAVDEKKVIIKDARGNIAHTVEGQLDCNNEQHKLFISETKIESYQIPEKDMLALSFEEIDAFTDFLFSKETADAMIEQMIAEAAQKTDEAPADERQDAS